MNRIKKSLVVLIMVSILAFSSNGLASNGDITCEGTATHVKAITSPMWHPITTAFQQPFNLPPGGTGTLGPALLSTTIFVEGTELSCLIAHFSAMTRVTDNYIVFQVTVDGEPMDGNLAVTGYTNPVVAQTEDPQFDLTRMAAYNFFKQVKPGKHTVEVLAAAGSGIDLNNPSGVWSPVLTLHYR